MPKTGAVYQVSIPGVRSGFEARPGYIYLPPAYLATPRPQLPVLVLLGGQPGDPRTWVDSGQIQAMMDGFANLHHGLAPIVVMPDDLGSEFANPMCLNSRLGNVQTYLTVDVPNWITSHLQVRSPEQGWAIGGWFIPLADLVIPARVVGEVSARSRPGAIRSWTMPRVVTGWWVALILTFFRFTYRTVDVQ